MKIWGWIMKGEAQQVQRFIRPGRKGNVEGKGSFMCLSAEKKPSAGVDWNEVGSNTVGKEVRVQVMLRLIGQD